MTDAAMGNADQSAYWNGRTGDKWAALQAEIDAVFAPATEAVLALAAVRPGERVLDIGCGCGETVVALAEAVGPAGQVTGVDLSEPMLEVAQRRLAAAALPQARLVMADASRHPFPPGGADLVFSRFGVMFFDDPAAALGQLRRALAPGGRLAFVCWQAMADNPWFAVPAEAVIGVVGPQPPTDPFAPGPFAFADAARLHALLGEAGFQSIAIAPHKMMMPLAAPGDVAAAARFLTQVGAAARLLGEVPPADAQAARLAVDAALRPYDGPDGVRLGGAVWLVSARA